MWTHYALPQLDTALPALRALPPGCPFRYSPQAPSQAEPVPADDACSPVPLQGWGRQWWSCLGQEGSPRARSPTRKEGKVAAGRTFLPGDSCSPSGLS